MESQKQKQSGFDTFKANQRIDGERTGASTMHSQAVAYGQSSVLTTQSTQGPSLEHLDESVLIHILSWLQDPRPLAQTSSTLHAASQTTLAAQLWFQKWYPCHPIASQRPLAIAALSWHGLRAHTVTDRQDRIPRLVKLLCSTAAHYLQQQQLHQQHQGVTQSQQQQLLLSYQLPRGVTHADVTRALHSTQQQVKLLQQLTTWHEHLLIPAAAASGNQPLLQHLLAEYGPSAAGRERSDCCCSPSTSSSRSGTSCSSSMRCTASPSHTATRSSSSSSSTSCTKVSGAASLQQWLWQHRHQQHDPQQQPQQQQQQQQQPSPRARWGKLLQPLPDYPGLKAFRHNVLQTALISAAKAGAVDCLQLLFGQLVSCQASVWDCAEALTAVAEAAAAAGRLQCLQLVWQVLRPPQVAAPPAAGGAGGVGGADGGADGVQQQPQEQPQQQRIEQGGRGVQQVVQQLAELQLGTAQEHVQQQQPEAELPAPQPHPALQLVGVSSYLLVAAARSGCCEVLAAVMQQMKAHMQKQQLPAALAAAGQQGHVAALQQLLQHPELSSRPLQLAACDAATNGWTPSTLQPLLQHTAAAFNQELIPLLAKPLVLALQQQRQEVVDAVMDVLMREAALDTGDLLADALLLLACQGQTERVSWIIKVAPTVLVKLGPRAASAALEGGHPRLAQLILDRGGERPPTYKAAAKRGQLTAAVAAGDAAAVAELLQEVRLPMVWSCEVAAVGGQGGATAAAAGPQAAAGGWQAPPPPIAAAPAAARQTHPTHCLLALLKRAALLDPDTVPQSVSVGILRQLLDALLDVEGHPRAQLNVLLGLARACFDLGRAVQLAVVVEAAGRPRAALLRPFLRELWSQLQLPNGQQQQQGWGSFAGGGSSSNTPCGGRAGGVGSSGGVTDSTTGGAGSSRGSNAVTTAGSSSGSSAMSTAGGSSGSSAMSTAGSSSGSSAMSTAGGSSGSSAMSTAGSRSGSSRAGSGDVLEAALSLMEQPQATDLVSSLLAQSYFAVCMPGEYLGATARPVQPAVHITSLRSFTRLLMRLAEREELLPGARFRDLPLFRLLVRTVLQSCDVDVLHALLLFMQRHGEAVMRGMPEDALRALRVEAEAVQAAEGGGAGE